MRILIIFLFVNLSVFSSDLFYATGELAFFPQLVEQDPTAIWAEENLEFTADIMVGFRYSFLFAEAALKTYIIKADSFMFQPYTQEYYIRAGIKYKFASIYYEHLCAHSVDGLGDNYGHDKISIMFDSRGFK